jgi:hypothetical protein
VVVGELLEHALAYAGFGLEIFPVGRDKRPLQSQLEATTDLDQLEEWWRRFPDALIGYRPATGIVLLDVDPRHGGLATWRAIRAELNSAFPLTRTHASGREDGGGHIWFKRPRGDLSTLKLDAWAKARDLGAEMPGTKRWTAGIDILRREHRYSILPPSRHPDTGRPYKWARGKSLTIEPAEMPRWLSDMLGRDEATTPAQTMVKVDPNSIADWYSSTHKLAPILRRARWTLVSGSGDDDGSEWQHPSATSAVSATVRHGCLFVYSTSTPFEPTEPGDPHGYTPFAVFATLEHSGDLRSAGRAAREQRQASEPSGVNLTMTPDPLGGADGSTATGDHDPSPETGLERVELEHLEAFWGQLPVLGRIRDFARARRCSPWAMLGVVLTRVAAATPPFVVLPPLVGSHLSLNLYVVLVGGSGAGKDAALSAGKDALTPAGAIEFATIGLGSGEGILDQFVEFVPPDKSTDTAAHIRQHTESVLFVNPEIETVSALKGRSSATLMPMLRDAWMGSELGFAYANQVRRLRVAEHRYRLCLILGCQPTSAGVLLDESNVGTPQRFLWLPVNDPMAPDRAPEVPEAMEWRLPGWSTARDHKVVLELCDEAAEAIDNARLERLRGTQVPDSPSGHALACQEKVAALLAILDGRTAITLPYWSMAGIVATVSTRTRELAESAVSYEAARRNTAQGRAEAQRKAVVRSTDEETALAKCGQRIMAIVARYEDQGVPAGQLRREIGARHRPMFEEAIDLLKGAGQVIEEEYEASGNTVMRYKATSP